MSKETNQQPPHLKLVSGLILAISRYSKETGLNVTGQAVSEQVGKEPIIVMYGAYSGDAVCWFNDAGKAHLYTLVNEKVKHIRSVLAIDIPGLQEQAKQLSEEFEKKHKK